MRKVTKKTRVSGSRGVGSDTLKILYETTKTSVRATLAFIPNSCIIADFILHRGVVVMPRNKFIKREV